MGVLWGTFAAVLPDLKAMLGVDEAQLGLLIFCTPLAAISAMLAAPAFGAALGRAALPLAVALMALAFALPGQAAVWWLFPLAMACAGAATGLNRCPDERPGRGDGDAPRGASDEPRACGLFLRLCRRGDPDRADARRRLVTGLGDGHDGGDRASVRADDAGT